MNEGLSFLRVRTCPGDTEFFSKNFCPKKIDTTVLLSSDRSKNYTHFPYPKCGRIVTGPEIGKFGEEYFISKCNQCVTHL